MPVCDCGWCDCCLCGVGNLLANFFLRSFLTLDVLDQSLSRRLVVSDLEQILIVQISRFTSYTSLCTQNKHTIRSVNSKSVDHARISFLNAMSLSFEGYDFTFNKYLN